MADRLAGATDAHEHERRQFATMALMGLLASTHNVIANLDRIDKGDVVRHAFAFADAMIEHIVEEQDSAASSSATDTASDASSGNAETATRAPAPSEARPAEGSER